MTDTWYLILSVFVVAVFVLAVFGTQPERRNPRKPRPPTWHTRRPR